MTWLLYSYKDDECDGWDLRMGLRSIERHLHLPNLQVMIVGDKPSWFRGGHHVPFETTRAKVDNILCKVHRGCELLAEQPKAYYLDDDYLLLDHVETIPAIHAGPIQEHAASVRRSKPADHWFRKAMEDSIFVLDRMGVLDPLSWERHRPMPIFPGQTERVLKPWAEGTMRIQADPFWRMLAGNLTDLKYLPSYQGLDVRGEKGPPSIGSSWISSDKVSGAWLSRLHARFTEPSRWESGRM
jgi:hypothetical protein